MKTSLPKTALMLLLSSLVLPGLAHAQAIDENAADREMQGGGGSGALASNGVDNEEVITLEEFQVSSSSIKDDYIATESTSGTRLSEKISDLPYSIEVITDQVIQDFQIFDDSELARFVGGSTTEPASEVGAVYSGTIRGFTPLVIRDGFHLAMPSTPSNTLQTEFIKGPMSVLYGRAEPGGFFNKVTRRPSTKLNNVSSFSYGDDGFRRFAIQSTGPLAKKSLGNKLYYLAYFDYVERDGWTGPVDFEKSKQYYMGLSFLYKFRPSTSLYATFEFQPTENTMGGTAYYTFDARRVVSEGGDVLKSSFGSKANGNTNTYHFKGDEDARQSDFYGLNLLFEHRINSKWAHRSSLQTYTKDTDKRFWTGSNVLYLYDPFMNTDPDYLATNPTKYIYTGSSSLGNGTYNDYKFNGTYSARNAGMHEQLDNCVAIQAELLGTFRRARSTHRVLAAIDGSFRKQDDTQYRHSIGLGGPNIPGNIIKINEDMSVADESIDAYYNSKLPTRRSEYYMSSDNELTSTTLGSFVSYRGSFLRHRLALMTSLRFDYYEDKVDNYHARKYPLPGEGDINVTREPQKAKSSKDGNKFTYSVGANYKIIGDKLLIYASTSTGFKNQRTIDNGLNQIVPPQQSQSVEFGFKGSGGNKFGYTISFYDMTLEDVSIYNDEYESSVHSGTGEVPQYNIAGKQTSRGFDGGITFKPVKDLVFIGTFGYVDSEVKEAGLGDKYFVVGKPSTNVAKWTASLIGRYTFGGVLKGFKTGFTATWNDRYVAAYETEGRPGSTEVSTDANYKREVPSLFKMGAFLSYEIRRGKILHAFSLNVHNLLDKEYYNRRGRPFYGRTFRGTYRIHF